MGSTAFRWKIEAWESNVSGAPTFTAKASITNTRVSHRPFVRGGRFFVSLYVDADDGSTLTATYLLYDHDALEVVGRFYEGNRAAVYSSTTIRRTIPAPWVDGNVVRLVAGYRARNPVRTDSYPLVYHFWDNAVGLVSLDFTARNRPTAHLAGSLFAADCGFVRCYDDPTHRRCACSRTAFIGTDSSPRDDRMHSVDSLNRFWPAAT